MLYGVLYRNMNKGVHGAFLFETKTDAVMGNQAMHNLQENGCREDDNNWTLLFRISMAELEDLDIKALTKIGKYSCQVFDDGLVITKAVKVTMINLDDGIIPDLFL